MSHAKHTTTGLSANCERFGQEVVKYFTAFEAILEFSCLALKLLVCQSPELRLEAIDFLYKRCHPLNFTLVFGPEDLRKKVVDHEPVAGWN